MSITLCTNAVTISIIIVNTDLYTDLTCLEFETLNVNSLDCAQRKRNKKKRIDVVPCTTFCDHRGYTEPFGTRELRFDEGTSITRCDCDYPMHRATWRLDLRQSRYGGGKNHDGWIIMGLIMQTWTTILIFYTWPLNDIPVVHDKDNYDCFDLLVRYLRQTCFSWQNDTINTVPNLHPFYPVYWMCLHDAVNVF